MSVFGYCRVSTQAQADEGQSLDVQRRQLEGWAHMHGQQLAEVFIERGISGSIPVTERPEGASLWGRLRPGDVIVASRLDRLFRSALDALQTVAELKEREVSLVLLDLGGDISGNGLSKLFLTIAAAFAEAERDRIRERIAQVKADQRDRGRYLGGSRPFGWRIGDDGHLKADEREQEALGKMHELRAAGLSLRVIADQLNAEGFNVSHVTVKNALAGERRDLWRRQPRTASVAAVQ